MPKGLPGKISEFCSKCRNKKELKTKRYCRKCSAEYTKRWRKLHPLTKEQHFKDIVRHKTLMRIRRGLLIRYPCEVCGDTKVEAHHDDYNKTYDVRWLCFKHHREHHKIKKLYGDSYAKESKDRQEADIGLKT